MPGGVFGVNAIPTWDPTKNLPRVGGRVVIGSVLSGLSLGVETAVSGLCSCANSPTVVAGVGPTKDPPTHKHTHTPILTHMHVQNVPIHKASLYAKHAYTHLHIKHTGTCTHTAMNTYAYTLAHTVPNIPTCTHTYTHMCMCLPTYVHSLHMHTQEHSPTSQTSHRREHIPVSTWFLQGLSGPLTTQHCLRPVGHCVPFSSEEPRC